MYQDKIKKMAAGKVSAMTLTKKQNIFIIARLAPKDFIADEDVSDATQIARDILSTRTNEEVESLADVINSLLKVGDGLLINLSITLLDEQASRTSVVMTQGRALYLLHDYFDLTTLLVKNVSWGELFATLTLMQSAEINHTLMEAQHYDESLRAHFQQTALHTANQLKAEIIDSIARAECLFDKKTSAIKSGGAGGVAKSKRIEPLKVEVIQRYLASYTGNTNKKAGEIIEAELLNEKSELMNLSNNEEKNLLFGKWIGAFKNGKWKMPL